MSKKRRSSSLFVLQTGDTRGHLQARHEMEDLEYAISNQPFDGVLSNTRKLGSVISPKNLRIAMILFFLTVLIFFGRAFGLQIMENGHYRALAEANRYQTNRVTPQRGMIFDRNGNVLTQNIPSFTLTMTIAKLPREEKERRAIFARVSALTGVQPTDFDLLLTDFSKGQTEPIPVKRHIPFEPAMRLAIEAKQLPGFDLETSSLRRYPNTITSLSHVLGYTGKVTGTDLETLYDQGYRPIDSIGKTGVELSAEKLLRGKPGEVVYEVDSRGKELSVVSKTEPVPGLDVVLTIDTEFQRYIEEQMKETFKKTGASRGSVVALNPQTGGVYALVSLPAYDNNQFAQGIETDSYNQLLSDPDQPLFFRALAGQFPSGSTFKPFVSYAALAEGVISEHTSFLSTGGLRVNEWFFPDWKAGGHGVTDVRKAIAESVNTFFYIIGGGFDKAVGLGVDRITDYAARFGFGQDTGIDLPGEADGFLPSKEWKERVKGERWYVGDTYHLAIGQGDFLATPIQMARATAIIANDGKMITPHVMASETKDQGSVKEFNASALTIVKQGMRQAVTQGSSRSLQSVPVAVAGKTGTAQTPTPDRLHSWFTGFAPYTNPEIAIVVLIEDGGESTDAAVPLAREVLTWWFQQNPTKKVDDQPKSR
ncbi:MAG: penicillin-binding protein 2 [Patescibacteria group bacterium]